MPDLKKAELIDGVVYIMSPPVSLEGHGGPHFDLIFWLGMYRATTPGVRGGDNSTLRLDLDTEPQPDACLFVEPSHGGRVRMEEGYIAGGPELVAEVAASSVSYDLHVKLQAYRRNEVQEYVVWRVYDSAIDWFVLHEGKYDPLARGESGLYQSRVMPGLWLDPDALISGDMGNLMKAAQLGLASPEHAAFVARLQLSAVPPPAET